MAPQLGCTGAHPQLRWCGSQLPVPAACPRKVFPELLARVGCGAQSEREISSWLSPGKRRHRSCGPRWPFLGGTGLPMARLGRVVGRPWCCADIASSALYRFRKFEFNPKDGIDNPALTLTEDTDGEGKGEPRFYLLSKGSTETFGFCLNEELGCRGHVIRQVEVGGLAQRRGLQDGDRLLQVNGHFVDHMEHHRVVQKIKSSGNQVLLAVLDGDSYEAAKALGRDLSQMLPADIRPRLCHITRDKSGFGFSVSGPEGTKGTFQLAVQQDGPAERAGVPPGSWLLELNGASVRSYSHAQLTRKLKQSGTKVTLLVASSAVEEFYRLRGLRVTAALADTSWLPFKVRELHMVKGPAGYGFLLKEDDCSSGATGQFLWDVDAGLPAEQAGMKEGDRLLAVNGESIEGLDHQQTVLRIRAHDDQVTLLVIDPAGDEFYHAIGLSPLLSFEDTDPASGSRTPSLPSPRGSPGLCHIEVGPKGPGSWLVAAANSIGITQSPRREEQRRLHQAF
ncbi:Na(+)/H(+) exchange regulatory cofactor NHE-RF4 isoform X1 [Falco biarmicus]|uniref:Na(+)/H(+) exchange regulatory cofactor NHE-RF4 isoform X1 n=1 Tax=Falco biarmicus TaxID=345155 RepID=UPI0024BC1F39|nr:Na(+)/H(+) exchange regulatory cofactor NHE-RF4 isoform X1 [Falco biarmicus]